MTKTIEPPRPWVTIRCATAWPSMKAPVRLTAMTRSHSARVCSRMLAVALVPALYISTSSAPNASKGAWASACAADDSLTSATKVDARPPARVIESTVAETPALLTSAHTTLAPSRASNSAPARPMPLPAPTTNAVFPSSLAILPPVLRLDTSSQSGPRACTSCCRGPGRACRAGSWRRTPRRILTSDLQCNLPAAKPMPGSCGLD